MLGKQENQERVRTGISGVTFTSYTKEDIKKLSVMQVANPQVFDHSGEPIKGGLHDAKLGASADVRRCEICGESEWSCPGHFGHISLSKPVYHPFYVKALSKLLSSICLTCKNMRILRQIAHQVSDALQMIKRGEILNHDALEALELDEAAWKDYQDYVEACVKNNEPMKPNMFSVQMKADLIKAFLQKASEHRGQCANCQQYTPKIKFDKDRFSFVMIMNDQRSDGIETIPVEDVKAILDEFYEGNKVFFNELFTENGPDQFFIETVCVTPSKFRPASIMNDKVNAHPSTSGYAEIIKAQNNLAKAIGNEDADAIKREHANLQNSVNVSFDKTLTTKNNQKLNGIRQILEKKEGLFRKNLMGKRVNYSARSVIAPDPYVATDEMGVPEIFAMTLSYPERVTEYNKDRLYEMVLNGPKKYPGANYIIDCNGVKKEIPKDDEERKARAQQIYAAQDGPYPMIVCRHVIDGDYVLINRQPTLHRVSILGMKCRVLPNQKTLRMHYSNCSSFNADFDGDEINLHLPQNELGRSEVKNLSLSSIHYVTPTAGSPIRGLIQDHVDSGALLTLKDKFFTRAEYQQLVFAAFGNEAARKITFLNPAIMLPVCLWTGKQVISTLLVNLTESKKPLELEAGSKFTSTLFAEFSKDGPWMTETTVRIHQSELVQGVIDKNQFGASQYGLVHSLFELYGSEMAGNFLTALTRLFTFYMQTHGFTCGIDDMGITAQAEKTRADMGDKLMQAAVKTAEKFVEDFGANTEGTLEERLGQLLVKPALKERFDAIIQGALNEVSTGVIKSVFPTQMSKPFPENQMIMMTQSGAKGAVVNVSQIACLLGQQALEGKRVPLMASGKTLPAFRPMDLSPIAGGFISSRFITGLKPQEYYFHCMAGREGLVDTAVKTANTGYLQRCLIKHIEGIHVCYDGTVRNADDSVVQFLYGEDGIDPVNNKYLKKFKFMENNYDAYRSKLHINDLIGNESVDCETAMAILSSDEERPVPIQASHAPHRCVGSISENFEKALNDYCNEELKKAGDDEEAQEEARRRLENLRGIALFNYFRSIIHPGENVGIIAAQAIGEPATQMTLNTFHLAGYGGANVTLGIPRLREILVVATRTPATPTMKVPLKTSDAEIAKRFVSQFSRVTLREITTSYTVSEDFFTASEFRRNRRIIIEVNLNRQKMREYEISDFIAETKIRADIAKTVKRKIGQVFKSTGTKIEQKEDDSYSTARSDEAALKQASKEEELGADHEKIESRKSEKNSYAQEPGEEKTVKEEEKEESKDSLTDENVFTNFNADERSCRIGVAYEVGNVSVKILLESIVEQCLDEIMVKQVAGVTRAAVMQKLNERDQRVVETEGVNFDAILGRMEDDVDLDHFYTNDIGSILKTYGIEAARAAIIKEVSEVFKAYSISVDARHLQLIADYVTQTGDWTGMSRHTMKACASPLQQMSFETTVQFLTQATLHGSSDAMQSPSACLAAGNIVKGGTGMCEILVPFE